MSIGETPHNMDMGALYFIGALVLLLTFSIVGISILRCCEDRDRYEGRLRNLHRVIADLQEKGKCGEGWQYALYDSSGCLSIDVVTGSVIDRIDNDSVFYREPVNAAGE